MSRRGEVRRFQTDTHAETQTQTPPELPYVKCECVEVKVVTSLLAPKIAEHEKTETLMQDLKSRWGEERAKHLDYVFVRGDLLIWSEKDRKYVPIKCVVVYGTRVWGALKEQAGLGGKPLPSDGTWQIIGMYFPESSVMLYTSKVVITMPYEKYLEKRERYRIVDEVRDESGNVKAVRVETLVNYEAIPERTIGWLVVRGLNKIPQQLKLRTVQIGRLRKHGRGWVEINWDKVTPCYLI